MTTLFTEAMNVSKISLGSVLLKINGSHWPAASSHWLWPLCGLCEVNTPFLIQLSHPWFPCHVPFGFFFPISTGPSQAYFSSSVPRGEVFSRTLCLSLLPLWQPTSLNAISSVWMAPVLDFCPRLSPGLQVCVHLLPWTPSPGPLQYLQPHWSKWNLLPFFPSPPFLISHLFMSRQSFSDPPACY